VSESEARDFHFLGICGTAMGSVAAALSERGFTVTGSDENVYPPMSTFLEQCNIALFSGYRAENIPAKADVVAPHGIEAVIGSLDDATLLQAEARAADAVVNAATHAVAALKW